MLQHPLTMGDGAVGECGPPLRQRRAQQADPLGAVAIALRPETGETEDMVAVSAHLAAEPETRLAVVARLAAAARLLRFVGGGERHCVASTGDGRRGA